MKRTVILSFSVLAVCAAFLVSPFVGLSRIAAAVDAHNAGMLSDRVDFGRLRQSLSSQIVATYLQITGRASKLGTLGNRIAVGVGTSLADPIVARLLNPETLVAFLNSANVSSGDLHLPGGTAPLQNGSLGSFWQGFVNSEYGIGNFYISLPTSAPADHQYRLRLQVLQWNWKLTGIDLPQRIRVLLANELKKKIGS